jgi:hypothetical protein
MIDFTLSHLMGVAEGNKGLRICAFEFLSGAMASLLDIQVGSPYYFELLYLYQRVIAPF